MSAVLSADLAYRYSLTREFPTLGEDRGHAVWMLCNSGEYRAGLHHAVQLIRETATARAAAPDDLRDRLQALCDAAMRNNWHLGAEAVSVTVAQVLAVVGEGSE